MTNNLTEGKPLWTILSFSIPMLIGGIFQQFYNMTDTLIVGNLVGSQALAAVGATNSCTFFLLSVSMGLTNAFSIVMAQHFGAENREMVRKTAASAIYLTGVISIIMALIGIFCTRPLLELLQVPSDIIGDSAVYLKICIACSFGQTAYNGAAAVLRAVGDSKTPLYFLIFSTLANVVLDLLFVAWFQMGVMGVAVATVISQILSAVLCILYIYWKFPIFRLERKDFVPDWNNIRSVVGIGLSMSVQSILCSIGDMTVTSVINSFGSSVVAAYTTAYRIQSFATMAYMNLASAFSIYAGQNLGARKFERIRDGFRKTALMILGLSIATAAVIFCFSAQLIGLFISQGDQNFTQVIEIGTGYLHITSVFFPFLGLIWLYNHTLRGLGDVNIPMLSGIVELVAKVGLSILLSALFGYVGIWWACPIGWVLGLIVPAVEYHTGRWKRLADKIVSQQ